MSRPREAPDTLKKLLALTAQMQELLARLLGEQVELPDVTVMSKGGDYPQLVSLDQCAAMVRRSKRTLFQHAGRPDPVTAARRGMPHLFDWVEMRPWLEKTFGILLPEVHPVYA
jgi:hypothetical protein